MGQLPEWLKQSRHRLDLGLQSSERLLFLEHLEIGQRHGAAERIAGIAVAVEECFEVFVLAEKGLVDFVGGECRGEWHVAAGQAFADRHQVRRDPLMLAGEHLAGAAEAGGHFIGNQAGHRTWCRAHEFVSDSPEERSAFRRRLVPVAR